MTPDQLVLVKAQEDKKVNDYLDLLIKNETKFYLAMEDGKRSMRFEIEPSYIKKLRDDKIFHSMASVVSMLISELARKELENENPENNES